MTENKPWHRQPGETAKAFHAFVLYRDMLPKERSLQKVRQKLTKTPPYLRYLKTWSSRFSWVARAQAYDDHLAEVKAEAQEHAIVEMTELQAREGRALQTVGMRRFVDEQGKVRIGIAQGMKDADAIRAIDVGAKLERTARGEPTEIVKDVTGRGVKRLSDEELLQIIEEQKRKDQLEGAMSKEKGGD